MNGSLAGAILGALYQGYVVDILRNDGESQSVPFQVTIGSTGVTFAEIRVSPTCCIPFFCITVHVIGQGHDFIFNLDVDLRGVDREFTVKFCDNFLLHWLIGLHRGLSGSAYKDSEV
jgi:hypothetical protein